MLVGKPKEEALRTAHGVPTAPPPNQSSAWKADPAVKAPHVGSLPHFMANSEEKGSVCALVSLCTAGTASASPPHGEVCRDYSHYYLYHYYYFLGICDAGVVGERDPALGDGSVSLGSSSPVSRGFSACSGAVQSHKLCSVWLWPPLGWFSSC